jgi:hypothetical protein
MLVRRYFSPRAEPAHVGALKNQPDAGPQGELVPELADFHVRWERVGCYGEEKVS